MIVSVIGVGLIGGSLVMSLKQEGIASRVIGVDASADHLRKAQELGLIDEGSLDLPTAVRRADLVIVAVPMDAMLTVLPQVLDVVDQQVVIDVGSTKQQLLAAVANHPQRSRFVAVHPMAGTEYAGPEAAVQGLFEEKTLVICDAENSNPAAVALVEDVFRRLRMRLVHLDAASHDVHTAYVSHISHLTSFSLALTVLEKEKEEQRIFDLAGGGFASTVRLAKSTPEMWVPIFRQNRLNVLDVLEEHLRQLQHLKDVIEQEDYATLTALIQQANHIRKVLK